MDIATILKYLGPIVGFGSIAFSLATKWRDANWRLTKVDAITGREHVCRFAGRVEWLRLKPDPTGDRCRIQSEEML